jgi:formylmethanofuran dehydrogenase subunit D
MVEYPSEDAIIELNKKALEKFKEKRGDRHKILSRTRIKIVLDVVIQCNGDY